MGNTSGTHWKFLHRRDGAIMSQQGDQDSGSQWTIGTWRSIGTLRPELCVAGFHCSPTPLDALNYVRGAVVAQVEVAGLHDRSLDKQAWQRMRLVRAWTWTPRDNVRLAIFSSEQVLGLYESRLPGDLRPRQAIDAARDALSTFTFSRAAAALCALRAAAAESAADKADIQESVAAAANAAANAAHAASTYLDAYSGYVNAALSARMSYADYGALVTAGDAGDAAAAAVQAAGYAYSDACDAAVAAAVARAALLAYGHTDETTADERVAADAVDTANAAVQAAIAYANMPEADMSYTGMRRRINAWMIEHIATQCPPIA